MIEIKNLTKYYGRNAAVKNLSFTVNDNEILGFLGPNGAGKTTTIKIMTGLLKPDQGVVELDGKNMLTDTLDLRRRIGYVPDHFGLYDNLKVSEYMEFFAACYHLEGFAARKRASSLLEQVGLGERKDAFVDGLSRGMQQRLCLARALIHDPEFLIMDEPTRGIDVGAKHEIYEIMSDLAKQGKAIIMISSEMSELLGMADRICVMCNGKLTGEIDQPEEMTQARVMGFATKF